MGPGYVVQFEGWVQASDAALQARGVLAFDSLEMPNGIIAMRGYEGAQPRESAQADRSPNAAGRYVADVVTGSPDSVS